MENFERNLGKYAEVIVKVGLNLKAGQRLIIGAPFFGTDGTPLEAYPLVRQIAEVAYQDGATYVGVNWDDEELQRIRVLNAPVHTMDEFATWKNDIVTEFVDNGDAVIIMLAQNPDLMGGLDSTKVQAKQKTEAEHLIFPKILASGANWLAIGVSIMSWAQKVFPDIKPEEAKVHLWDTIFEASRINYDDPIAEWKRHMAQLAKYSDYLNSKQYTALKFTSPDTNLTVGLPEGHIWCGGNKDISTGFVSNIPTEEVFTLPHKNRINGVVTATKPMSYGGGLIDKFTLKFSEGVVEHATAEVGQDVLNSILNTDEPSRNLGEVALVPHNSPISQSGLLFYNILYDENASNHLALGNAYRFTMKNGEGMTSEEFAAAGGNESLTHADFMIGSGEMDVDGMLVEGTTEPVMRSGEWAFDV